MEEQPEPIDWRTQDWTEVRVSRLKDHHNFTLWGQSIAGTRTTLIIEELKVVLDLGFFPRKAAGYETILISHGHADHMGSLHYHALDRNLQKMEQPTYVIPEYCVPYFNQAYQALKHLNRHIDGELRANYKLIGTDPKGNTSEEVMFLPKGKGKKYRVKSYEMIHTVPAVGYVIFEIRKCLRPDLKEKLQTGEITEKDIGAIAKSGEDVNKTTEVPLIGYTGDTTINGLLRHPDLLNSETLIVECTYLNAELDDDKNDTPKECKRRGHIHEQHIVEHADQFKCKELMLCHFSRKYKREHIFEARDRLQKLFGDRLIVSVFLD